MDARIPTDLQFLLTNYIDLLTSEIGDSLYGVYIYGSVALNSYDNETSDIDFITLVTRELTEEEILRLIKVHKKLKKAIPDAIRLEGEYVNYEDVKNKITNKSYPYFASGEYQGLISIKNIDWFCIKENCIPLMENDIRSFIELDWEKIKSELYFILNHYYSDIVDWRKLKYDRWVASVVLTLCRIYYTLENKKIISKLNAGKYVLEKVPDEWHLLINEALRIQRNTSDISLFKSKAKRAKRTKEFSVYISDLCNIKYL